MRNSYKKTHYPKVLNFKHLSLCAAAKVAVKKKRILFKNDQLIGLTFLV